MLRRTALQTLGLGLATSHAHASWMPYPADQVVRIEPTLRNAPATAAPAVATTIRIEPVISDFKPQGAIRQRLESSPSKSRTALPALREQPPRAYVKVAEQHGVHPWLLFGVALQESKIKFGARELPYPWTLCVQGHGHRFSSYAQTLAALRRYVTSNITNVDCGCMQVNWRWHSDKLVSFERALDPYPNLTVGAQILRRHFDVHRNWQHAVALYHTGSEDTAEKRARGLRYSTGALNRLARMGVDVSELLGRRHA